MIEECRHPDGWKVTDEFEVYEYGADNVEVTVRWPICKAEKRIKFDVINVRDAV